MSNMGVEIISSVSNTIEHFKTSQLKVNEIKMKRKVSAVRQTKDGDTSNLSMKSKLRSFKREFGGRSGARIPLRNLPSIRNDDSVAPQIRRLSRERWSRIRSNSDRGSNLGHSSTVSFKVSRAESPKPYSYKSMKARYGRIIRSADKLPEVINLNFGKIR